MIGELLINALAGAKLSSPLNEVKKSGIQLKVANSILQQLKTSVKELEKDVESLKKADGN